MMKKLFVLMIALMAIAMGAKAVESLIITGIQVTDDNKYDILGDGTVSYNSDDRILTFRNANITYQGTIVSCNVPNITVVFLGSNTLKSLSKYGGYSTVISESSSEFNNIGVTLTGPGELTAYGDIYGTKGLLTIKGGLKLTLMDGCFSSPVKHANIAFSDPGTLVRAYASDDDFTVISNFESLTLNDGLQITEPAGAYYDTSKQRLCYANGNEVIKQWVTIQYPRQSIGVWINNNALNSSYTSGSGWSYNNADNTLYLTGNITASEASTAIYVRGDLNPTLNICVQGDCTLSGNFEHGLMFSGNGRHCIYGDGTLNIKSRVVDISGAISSAASDLIFKGLTLNIEQYGGVGINCYSANSITLDSCAISIKTTNGTAWYRHSTCTPELINCKPTSPEGSRLIKNGWYYDVENESGTTSSAQVVDGIIERKFYYPLWYQGEQMNNFSNYSQWYNPEENQFNVSYCVTTDEPAIVNGIKDLKVKAIRGVASSWYWISSKNILLTHADMTLTQQESVQLPMTSKEESVLCVDNNATLTIEDVNLYLHSLNKWAITGNGQNEKLVLRNAVITAYGEEGAIGGFSDIVLENCHILYPEGGYIKNGTVVDKMGRVAKQVIITNVDNSQYCYDLYVWNTQVTMQNKNDILGNGMFRFDPATLTLYFKGGKPNGKKSFSSKVPGLVIRVLGDTELEAAQFAINMNAPTTITGQGLLKLKGSNTLFISDNAFLNLVNANLEIEASIYGIRGGDDTRLLVKNSNLKISGGDQGAIHVGRSITLEDCEIVEPAGAYVYEGNNFAIISDANGLQQASNITIKALKPQIPTAIESVEDVPATSQQPMYNLAGQRVGQSYKGVVITNGRKVLVK